VSLDAQLDALVNEVGGAQVERLRRAPRGLGGLDAALAALTSAPLPEHEQVRAPALEPEVVPVPEPELAHAPEPELEATPVPAVPLDTDLSPMRDESVATEHGIEQEVDDDYIEAAADAGGPAQIDFDIVDEEDDPLDEDATVEADLRRYFASDEDRDRALLAAPPAERKPAEVDPEATPSPKRDSSLLTSVKKLFRK
jgi:hypothetical protein